MDKVTAEVAIVIKRPQNTIKYVSRCLGVIGPLHYEGKKLNSWRSFMEVLLSLDPRIILPVPVL